MSRGLGVTTTLREILPEWAVPIFASLSTFGDLILIVPVLGLLALLDITRRVRRASSQTANSGQPPSAASTIPPRLWSDRSAFLVAAVFGGLALVVFLKSLFSVSRPPTELHAVTPSEYGFPSGHTMAATIFWGGVALWSEVGPRWSRFAVASVIVPAVALSRLALGVHYLVDVLASIAIGVAYLVLIARITDERPARAFGVAIAIAVLAVIVTGGNTRALLAISGTIVVAIGWVVLDRELVRRSVSRVVAKKV